MPVGISAIFSFYLLILLSFLFSFCCVTFVMKTGVVRRQWGHRMGARLLQYRIAIKNLG